MKYIPLFFYFAVYFFVIRLYNNAKFYETGADMEDKEVIEKIKHYIIKNDISLKKLAVASGISYHKLWSLLNQSGTIKLGDYIALCKAFQEPFDLFLP